jgi:[acyl-carrier-protein] S-malonyltransferase
MRHARDEFSKVLERTPFRDPAVPMVGNVHATMIRTADGLREELSEHLVHGVQWVATIRNMASIGVTDFVEIGPGRVLTGLIKRISPESNAHALDEADDGWLPEAPAPPAAKRQKKPKTQL